MSVRTLLFHTVAAQVGSGTADVHAFSSCTQQAAHSADSTPPEPGRVSLDTGQRAAVEHSASRVRSTCITLALLFTLCSAGMSQGQVLMVASYCV